MYLLFYLVKMYYILPSKKLKVIKNRLTFKKILWL